MDTKHIGRPSLGQPMAHLGVSVFTALLEKLDRLRGSISRSAYIRQLIAAVDEDHYMGDLDDMAARSSATLATETEHRLRNDLQVYVACLTMAIEALEDVEGCQGYSVEAAKTLGFLRTIRAHQDSDKRFGELEHRLSREAKASDAAARRHKARAEELTAQVHAQIAMISRQDQTILDIDESLIRWKLVAGVRALKIADLNDECDALRQAVLDLTASETP